MDHWVKKFEEFIDLSKAKGLSWAGKRGIDNVPNIRTLLSRKALT